MYSDKFETKSPVSIPWVPYLSVRESFTLLRSFGVTQGAWRENFLEALLLALKLWFESDLFLTGMTSFISALCSNCQEELIAIHMLKFTSTESKSNYNPEILVVAFSENRGLIEPMKEEHIFSKSFFPWWLGMEGSCAVCIDWRISWSSSNTEFHLLWTS